MLEKIHFRRTDPSETVIYELVKKVLIVDSDTQKGSQVERIIKRQNHLSLGIVDNIFDLEKKIKAFEPDMIFINLLTEGQLDGYQITKILKLDHDISFAVYYDDEMPKQEKWAEELNPDHLIKYTSNENTLSQKIEESLR